MAPSPQNKKVPPPIIIKRKKHRKAEGGHGAAAWKIAHADFMTTLMAFFLVMWLVTNLSSEKRKALSDYFDPLSLKIQENATGNEGVLLNGRSVDKDAPSSDNAKPPAAEKQPTQNQKVGTVSYKVTAKDQVSLSVQEEKKMFSQVSKELQEKLKHQDLHAIKDNVTIEETSEGLRIEIVDLSHQPMFAKGSSFLYSPAEKLLRTIAQTIRHVPHRIMIAGHTDAAQYASKRGYNNWNLSADRANVARLVVASVVGDHRIYAITGRADTELKDPYNPLSPNNRRVEIILLSAIKNPSGKRPSSPSPK